MTARREVPWSVLVRALAVQGSWNYETLTGTGFAFAILPALRRLYADPALLDEAVRRHEAPFNSHPYLVPLALGAVIRLERDGEDPAMIARFKAALRGSLGTLGDQLVWAGWRPVCLLFALVLVLVGIPWWGAVVAFLLVYNIGHGTLMVWGLELGLKEGRHVADRLRPALMRTTHPRLMVAGAFLAAFAVMILVTAGVQGLIERPGWIWGVLGLGGAAAGAWWGDRARAGGAVAVALLVVVALVVGVVS
jgi:mannose PTS system EIID component